MSNQRILVVDDEKNIRLTLVQCLEPLGYEVKTAVNGEDALSQLQQNLFDLILLDLKMPGIDGMELLRRSKDVQPGLIAIMISAHGSVENAVEAMKLGAVDFLQKPFTPREIREMVGGVLGRDNISESSTDYDSLMTAAKKWIIKREFEEAISLVGQAIGQNPNNPEAFNLLGELLEATGDRLQALKNYRVAIDLDPTYKQAQNNLQRATSSSKRPSL